MEFLVWSASVITVLLIAELITEYNHKEHDFNNYKLCHFCISTFALVLVIIPFSLLCNFYKTQDEISPVATVILVFCLIVLILQSVHSVLSFMRCFLPAYLAIITTRFTLPKKNLVENELTLHTSLENSVQPESPISVSGQNYGLKK